MGVVENTGSGWEEAAEKEEAEEEMGVVGETGSGWEEAAEEEEME